MNDKEHLESVLRHINRVQENCFILAKKLADNSEDDFARGLIANGLIHDNSKLTSKFEWTYLREGVPDEMFKLAIDEHRNSNRHHPEFYQGGLKEMPRIYLAEFVADITARSQEFGTDVRDWLKDKAFKKYKISSNCKVYKEIKDFMGLLLDKKFA